MGRGVSKCDASALAPTFAYGALYTGSLDGTVHALDAKTGCIRWAFKTTAEVRTPVLVQSTRDAGTQAPLAFFGDLIGRTYAVDALTGKEAWRAKAAEHPSATITGSPVYPAPSLRDLTSTSGRAPCWQG